MSRQLQPLLPSFFLPFVRWFDANVWDKSRTQITEELVALAVKTLPKPPSADGVPRKNFGDALAEQLALVPDPGDGTLNRGTLTCVALLIIICASERDWLPAPVALFLPVTPLDSHVS
jgi:hypothetical protein